MNNKDDPTKRAQAVRIHDHYRRVGDRMIREFKDDQASIRRLSDVQKRKAIGGKFLGFGIYGKE